MTNIKDEIRKTLSAVPESYCGAWEDLKGRVKMIVIERGGSIGQSEQKTENKLRHQLDVLIGLKTAQPGKWSKELGDVKSKFEIIDSDKGRAAITRARAEKMLAREQPNKRALGDEKRYQAKNERRHINFRNETTCNKESIKSAFVEHYSNLFGQETDGP